MVSKVQICNMALSSVGGNGIEGIDEGSADAKQCRIWYDQALRQTLETANWPFARKRRLLALHGTDADGVTWAYRYQLPDDLVAARYIVNPAGRQADPVPYLIETAGETNTMSLLANLEDATLVYTFYQTSTALYPAMFTSMLALALASYIAFPISGKETVKKAAVKEFNDLALLAPAFVLNQEVPEKPREAEAIRARS